MKLFRFKKDRFGGPLKDNQQPAFGLPDANDELKQLQHNLMQTGAQLSRNIQEMHTQLGGLDLALNRLSFNLKMRDEYLPMIFPDQNAVNQLVNEIDQFKYSQLQAKNIYSPHYLLFHTRDKAWLTRYVTKAIKQLNPQQKINPNLIQDYVATSTLFANRCHELEQNIVKAYITQTMQQQIHESEFEPPKKLHHAFHGEYDKFLRSSVITSARLLGLDRHTAEVGLETNADLWREQAMIDTFDTKFYPDAKYPPEAKDQAEWCNLRAKHLDVWLKQREYLYYHDNKAILDELNLKTNFMQMTPPEAMQLDAIVDGYEKVRQVFFENLDQKYGQNRIHDQFDIRTL